MAGARPLRVLRIDGGTALAAPAPCVTIGNFDGVHRGHRALVSAAVEWARTHAGTAVVLSFDPHPARVLAPERAPAALQTAGQKAELLQALGVDVLAVLPFDRARAETTPAAFVESVLGDALRARRVVVGRGFRFGRRQSGDVAMLEALGRVHGFETAALAPVLERGEPISSSRVRESLAGGDVAAAAALLGRPYSIDGEVVRGDGRGREIGVPTANLATENEVVPARGVYAALCRLAAGETRAAVVNVGERPTFGGTTLTIEAHLLDFAGDLYGSRLRLSFTHWLRGEQRFSGAQALVLQIREDVARARRLVSEAGGGGV